MTKPPGLPEWLQRARGSWTHTGRARPSFAVKPRPGQESVWDYPRPPRLESDAREVEVKLGTTRIAQSRDAYRVLETASPPTFYLPPGAVHIELLRPVARRSLCEWKGEARYWDVVTQEGEALRAAWSYPRPFPGFETIAGFFSFHPGCLECSVAGERVKPQPGGFYGGWVTAELVGPFKGAPGTEAW